MRIALGIEYDGTGYHGWQFQTSYQSVQACIERAVSPGCRRVYLRSFVLVERMQAFML